MTDPLPRGRFAPSPTGPLHFGSLVAAVGSYCHTKSRGGTWLVRMEDLDPPRELSGAADTILRSLEAHGLYWDESVLYQSRRTEAYLEALEQLHQKELLYHCQCSRKEIEAAGHTGIEGYRYTGQCRERKVTNEDSAIRIRTPDRELVLHDVLQGKIRQNLFRDIGDFVLRRRDGLFSYQLAVVVDDAAQGISEVVRGTDLLASTPRQAWLFEQLGLAAPEWLHLPIAVNRQRQKLSKQTGARALDPSLASANLARALDFLGHTVPAELVRASAAEILQWGVESWQVDRLPGVVKIEHSDRPD